MTDGSAARTGTGRPVDDSMPVGDRRRGDRPAARLLDRFEFQVLEKPEALVFAGNVETLSRADLWLAAGIAAGEICSAVGNDKRVVVVHLPDSAAWLVTFVAVLRAGHIPAPLPITATVEDLRRVLGMVEPALVISTSEGSEALPGRAVLEAASQATGVSVALAEGTTLSIRHRAAGSPGTVPVAEEAALVTLTPGKAFSHSDDHLIAQNQRLVDSYSMSEHTPVIMPCPGGLGSSMVHGTCLSMFLGAPLILQDNGDMGALDLADRKV